VVGPTVWNCLGNDADLKIASFGRLLKTRLSVQQYSHCVKPLEALCDDNDPYDYIDNVTIIIHFIETKLFLPLSITLHSTLKSRKNF